MNILLEGLFFAPSEWLLILIIILLLFGGKKVPELMKGMGQGIKNFKDGMNGADENSKHDNNQGNSTPNNNPGN